MNVWMEDLGLEVQFGWSNGVIRGEADFDQEYMIGVRCVTWSFDEGLPSQQVVFVEHQQKFVELLLRGLYCLLH